MAVRVALAGATGNMGPAILQAMLDAGFEVTILTRQGSTSTDSLPVNSNQRIVKVDYSDVNVLKSALQGIEVVVSTLASAALDTQKPLVDAALAAGVKRIIPSDFGSDLDNPLDRKLPVFRGKVETQEYLEELAKSNPNFTYTHMYNGLFFDWGIQIGLIVNAKEHKATIYDGGDVPISMTTLSTIGNAVVGVINNLDATKNRAVRYHNGVFSQNKLIDMFKKIDGKDWTTEQASTAEIEKGAYEALEKGENIEVAMLDFIRRAAFSKEHEPAFTGKLDNEILGVKEMTNEEVVEMLKGLL
ncbi:hypothetical protein LTR70_010440 [Exophiala xenobiotica]|uniref:NmrA-like domain-containing protein n=1 Tax=Lithohypha guttulata TaxID=1690604 RepID=A0ABR0JVI6_9EURO|nr:hypothetical protein LTR24_010437 [Lithohypha guttulata]KAK5309263.1 hypothetical protein LTR70_010440 [Exophiala xenobiotica]